MSHKTNAKATPNNPKALSTAKVRPPALVFVAVVEAAAGAVVVPLVDVALVPVLVDVDLVPALVVVDEAPASGTPEVYAPVLTFPLPPS